MMAFGGVDPGEKRTRFLWNAPVFHGTSAFHGTADRLRPGKGAVHRVNPGLEGEAVDGVLANQEAATAPPAPIKTAPAPLLRRAMALGERMTVRALLAARA